ncbi:MAG: GNAT family N-acetyltransferase [Candidatus Micrarchaeota archaeon]
MEPIIRNAAIGDIPEITKIQHSLAYPGRSDGFLIQKRSGEEFLRLMKACKYFFVAEVGGKIAGYMLVMDENAGFSDNEIFSFYKKNYSNFVLVDQIGVQTDFQGNGIGKALYGKLLSVEKKRILLEIFIKPMNSISVKCHEALGFRRTGDIIRMKIGYEAEVYEYGRK